MDLDCSFALISLLTPREKAGKPTLVESSLKSKSLKKVKVNLTTKSNNLCKDLTEEKENQDPENQPMSENGTNKHNKYVTRSTSTSSNDKMSPVFPVNLNNIAIRKTRSRTKKNIECSPLKLSDNVLSGSDKRYSDKNNSQKEGQLLFFNEIINISSEVEDNLCDIVSTNNTKIDKKKFAKPKRVSDSSLEIVESSCSEVKPEASTSLSTAYDSDSFQIKIKHGTKIIPETPETDQSTQSNSNNKRKSSFTSLKNNPLNSSDSSIGGNSKQNVRVKRKSSLLSFGSDKLKQPSTNSNNSLKFKNKNTDKIKPILTSTPEQKQANSFVLSSSNEIENEKSYFSEQNFIDKKRSSVKVINLSSCSETEEKPRKKLRSSNNSTLSDMFNLESSIVEISKKVDDSEVFENGRNYSKTDVLNTSISPVLKEINMKDEFHKNSDVNREIKGKIKHIPKGKVSPEDENICNTNRKKMSRKGKDKCNKNSPDNHKISSLVLSQEVIPKFEHINKWLDDTQEKIVTSLNTYSSVDNSLVNKKDIIPIPTHLRHKVSLSPRIKKKKAKAKSSLEEEQKLFEELYGADLEKRLIDDIDAVKSTSSFRESVEFSENVLDRLYGTVWQENNTNTKSEPRREKKKSSKAKNLRTERKKQRTSIYEVFSSSSSEDRFEEFLENVQRDKSDSTKRRSRRRMTREFIDDSESDDDTSLVFYQNILSSAVKNEINSIKSDNESETSPVRINRRRLSFGSSQDTCSESGQCDIRRNKGKKNLDARKTKTQKSRSKKKAEVDVKDNDEKGVFSLITPVKTEDKKTVKDKASKTANTEVPKSTSKTKTPKNTTKPKDIINTEEKLKGIYLRDVGDFKMPKSISSLKTPVKHMKTPEVPSSPSLSFLSSLSEMTAGLPCHPEALLYKKDFKNKKEELTKKLFILYNREVFEGQLPEDMLIQWNIRMTSTSGYCYNKRIYRENKIFRSSRIVLSTKILDRADRLRDTLIHELCHAATWIVNGTSDGHGPIWRSWADKANRRFPELPVIKRCHDYAITTKFTYKCMSCGYSIGRHSKSLNTERKRCGFCFGKFQVFVTAKMSTASATSGSDSVKTPRNPTGFALFVKENYALVKKENNVPHAQVMKLLSQKFAEVKISKQKSDEPS